MVRGLWLVGVLNGKFGKQDPSFKSPAEPETEAHQYTALFYFLNLLAQFDRLHVFMNSQKFDSWRPNGKKKTTNLRLRNPSAKTRDANITRTRDFEIHQKLFREFDIRPNWDPPFSAVFLMPIGETESPTPNCTATFQLCQTVSDSKGLALLVIATITANCEQGSLSCGGQHADT